MLTGFYKWLTSWKVIRVLIMVLIVVLIALFIVGLWYINRRYQLETDLLSPFPGLHPYWLPLLFVLVLLGALLGYWFFKLLTDPQSGEFPDIDDAWVDGLAALDGAGIDVKELPLFLVVGTPATTPADFFAATKLPFLVRGEPRRPEAPVKLYASRDAVFVSCEGVSALARLGTLLARKGIAAPVGAPKTELGHVNLLDSPSAPAEVVPGDQRVTGLGSLPGASLTAASDVWLPTVDANAVATLATDERERSAHRLKYLCHLIAEKRRPFCPANGLIWLIPVAATESETLADQAAVVCRADLLAAEAGLQVNCPSTAVICDAQHLTGFRDLLRGLPETFARERLLGRSYPLVPGVPPAQQPGVLFDGLDWVARHLVPAVAYQRFGSEAEGNGERWSATNARLWALTSDLYERRGAMARLLAQGVAEGSSRPPMLAGAYLAGTGPDEQDQAFAAGIVQQLVALQNNIAWTAAADSEERDYRRMIIIGYTSAFLLVLAVIAFGYLTWWR